MFIKSSRIWGYHKLGITWLLVGFWGRILILLFSVGEWISAGFLVSRYFDRACAPGSYLTDWGPTTCSQHSFKLTLHLCDDTHFKLSCYHVCPSTGYFIGFDSFPALCHAQGCTPKCHSELLQPIVICFCPSIQAPWKGGIVVQMFVSPHPHICMSKSQCDGIREWVLWEMTRSWMWTPQEWE